MVVELKPLEKHQKVGNTRYSTSCLQLLINRRHLKMTKISAATQRLALRGRILSVCQKGENWKMDSFPLAVHVRDTEIDFKLRWPGGHRRKCGRPDDPDALCFFFSSRRRILPCRRRLSASDIFHLDDEERAILCYGPTRLAVILGNLKPNHPIALLSTHTDTRERTSFQDSGIRSFPLLDHWMITSMATDFGC